MASLAVRSARRSRRPDSTVRRWLQELVDLEYLDVDGARAAQGKAARYRLTNRGPRDDVVLGLLTPSELQGRLS